VSYKIAVLLGGTSAERDVSLVTGIEIARSLDQKHHQVVAIDCAYGIQTIDFKDTNTNHLIRISPSEIEKQRKQLNQNILRTVEFLIKENFDLVFIALHGGYGENGQLQAILDLANIPYTGSGALASSLGMNKNMSKMLFQQNDIPTAQWIYLENKKLIVQDEIEKIGLPLVVKPNDQGSTVGLTVVENLDDLPFAISRAFDYSQSIIIEKYIAGREITAAILGYDPLPLIEIIPKSGIYDYECKYQKGMSQYIVPAVLPAKVTELIQSLALNAYKTLGCRHYARVDFRLSKEMQPYCLEVNTLPGMTPTSLVPKAAKAIGINFPELVEKIVELALT